MLYHFNIYFINHTFYGGGGLVSLMAIQVCKQESGEQIVRPIHLFFKSSLVSSNK